MKAPSQYVEHVGIMAEYYGAIAPGSRDAELEESFEAIYDAALDVEYGEAKAYLAGLDSDAMETLRQFHHLADDINVAELDEEGAYNLLVHRYEQLDFNGDGLIQSGAADMVSLFSRDMPNDLKRGIVETVGQMQEEGLDYFRDVSPILMQLHFQFDPYVRERLLEGARGMDNVQAVTPEFTFQALLEMQERLHHPTGGMVVSEKYVETFDRFMEILGGILNENVSSKADTAPEAGRAQTSEKEEERYVRDPSIAAFFKQVDAAGGALSFIQEQNLLKIKQLLKEKEKELMGKMGLNAEPPLRGRARAEAIKAVAEALEAYEKELMEKLEKNSKAPRFDKDANLRLLINRTTEEGKAFQLLASEPEQRRFDNKKGKQTF